MAFSLGLFFKEKRKTSQVFVMACHPFGCRVVQRVLEHCTQQQVFIQYWSIFVSLVLVLVIVTGIDTGH